MEVKSFDQIYDDMRNYIIAHQDKLTDFNDGSVLSSQIEATAREIAMVYVRCRVGFSSFLRSLPYSVFGFRMKDGVKASTKVIFSRSKTFSYDTPIPAGTIVAAGNLNFLTSEAGVVLSGEINSAPVSAIAQNVGDKYNVSTGTVKAIVSMLPADIISANNPIPATGGENTEDWAAYMERFADYILGLSRTNFDGFLSGLTEDHTVRSLQIEEHFPPLDGIFNMTVYLEDGSGGMTPEAIANVKKKIDGNMTSDNGGYRAPGINIRYLTPDIVPVTLHVKVTTDTDVTNEIDESVVVFEVIEEIRKFINGFKIGESVLLSDIIIVLKRISYVVDDVKVISPVENISINIRQIARLEDCIVTVVIQ
jgi:uncharacterized phage protein gp47/JayE